MKIRFARKLEKVQNYKKQEQQEYKDVEKYGFDVAFWRENCYSKWGVGIYLLYVCLEQHLLYFPSSIIPTIYAFSF